MAIFGRLGVLTMAAIGSCIFVNVKVDRLMNKEHHDMTRTRLMISKEAEEQGIIIDRLKKELQENKKMARFHEEAKEQEIGLLKKELEELKNSITKERQQRPPAIKAPVAIEATKDSQSQGDQTILLPRSSINGLHTPNNTILSKRTLSWLDHLKLGKFIGKGIASHVFQAIFDDEPNNNKQYIAKLTGNYDGSNYTIDLARASVEINDRVSPRLSPHPNIPAVRYFIERMPNPFLTGKLELYPGTTKMDKERLLNCTEISIIIQERATPTHEHIEKNTETQGLGVPANQVRCFLRRLLELFDYVHSKHVMYVDTELRNMLLQDGKIILFDWNYAKIFEPGFPVPTFIVSEEGKFASEGKVYKFISPMHVTDVHKVGRIIHKFLGRQAMKLKKSGDNGTGVVSKRDRELLRNMKSIMNRKKAPTMKWFLENHEYFQIERNETCDLTW